VAVNIWTMNVCGLCSMYHQSYAFLKQKEDPYPCTTRDCMFRAFAFPACVKDLEERELDIMIKIKSWRLLILAE